MAEAQVVIRHAHADYQRGDIVVNPKAVEALLRDHPDKVMKIVPAKQGRS